MTEGQGDEEEIVRRGLRKREAGLFCRHEVVRVHRRDRVGSEESSLVLSSLSCLFRFPSTPFDTFSSVFLLFMLSSSSFKKYMSFDFL